jgi:hypothetical protein
MNDLTEKYRSVFGTEMGREVLVDILTMTHFGETLNADNPHRVMEYNVGVAIMAKMGIFSPGTKMQVVRALASVVPNQNKIKEE